MDLRRTGHVPSVKAVMTPFPWSVEADEPVERARALMREHGIHHLPVTEAGRPAGVVRDDDLDGAAGDGATTVGEVFSRRAYVVELDAALDSVLLHMAEHHLDAAVVVRRGRLAGIFTATDACRCFGEWLRDTFDPSGGEAA